MSDIEQTCTYRQSTEPMTVQLLVHRLRVALFALTKNCALLTCALRLLVQSPCAAQERNPQLVMETSLGKVRLELFADKAPLSVKNFLQYADEKFYDGLVFHRVIPNFMTQAGGMGQDLKEKPGRAPIANEAGNGLSNARGTLAMARTVVKDSATSQFFVNLKDNSFLDRAKSNDKVGYAVFGRVIDGMEVIDKISRVKTGARGGHQDVPLEPVVIRSLRRAADFTLAVGGPLVAGKPISITAQVDFPSAGQALTLVLPPGLDRVEGKEIQAVPLSFGPTLVLWRVQAQQPGEFAVSVRSSTGVTRSQTIKVLRSPKATS
jgi:cyclophilin family peptidyl-prolyl cis-trans isomerase